METQIPAWLLALIGVFILVGIVIFFVMAGIGPFREILTPNLPQNILNIGGGR